MEGNSTSSRSSMLSINMRVFKTVLLIAFFGASFVRCLPVADKPTESKVESETKSKIESETKTEVTSLVPQEIVTTAVPSTYSDTTDYYDQRQNGTENYRIHVDGVVLVFAPVEALLLAGAAANSEPNLSISSQGASPAQSISELDKPAVDSVQNKTDLAISKTIHK